MLFITQLGKLSFMIPLRKLMAIIIFAKKLCIATDITEFGPHTIVIEDDQHHVFDDETYHAKSRTYEILKTIPDLPTADYKGQIDYPNCCVGGMRAVCVIPNGQFYQYATFNIYDCVGIILSKNSGKILACHVDRCGNFASLAELVNAFESEPGQIIGAHLVSTVASELMLRIYHYLIEKSIKVLSLTCPKLDGKDHIICEFESDHGPGKVTHFYPTKYFELAIKKQVDAEDLFTDDFYDSYLRCSTIFVDAKSGYISAGFSAIPDPKMHDHLACKEGTESYWPDLLQAYPHIKYGYFGVFAKSKDHNMKFLPFP